MPMKMMPMKPAIKKSISGSANATAVFNWRSKSPSVTAAMRTSFRVEFAAFFRHGNHFQNRAGKKFFAFGETLAEPAALLHRVSMERETGVHKNLIAGWIYARRSDHEPAERPRRSNVPSIRQKTRHRELRVQRADDLASAKTIFSQTRLPFSDVNHVLARNPIAMIPAPTNNP